MLNSEDLDSLNRQNREPKKIKGMTWTVLNIW